MSPETAHDNATDRDFQMMVQIDMAMTAFQSNWSHCGYISTYLARTISHNRPDSVLFANLFSAALNELLELTFRAPNAAGTFACKISRHEGTEKIDLTFACGEERRRLFEKAVARIRGGNVESDYINALSSAPSSSLDMLLIELAISYNATLSITPHADDTMTLSVELPLEGVSH